MSTLPSPSKRKQSEIDIILTLMPSLGLQNWSKLSADRTPSTRCSRVDRHCCCQRVTRVREYGGWRKVNLTLRRIYDRKWITARSTNSEWKAPVSLRRIFHNFLHTSQNLVNYCHSQQKCCRLSHNNKPSHWLVVSKLSLLLY